MAAMAACHLPPATCEAIGFLLALVPMDASGLVSKDTCVGAAGLASTDAGVGDSFTPPDAAGVGALATSVSSDAAASGALARVVGVVMVCLGRAFGM